MEWNGVRYDNYLRGAHLVVVPFVLDFSSFFPVKYNNDDDDDDVELKLETVMCL